MHWLLHHISTFVTVRSHTIQMTTGFIIILITSATHAWHAHQPTQEDKTETLASPANTRPRRWPHQQIWNRDETKTLASPAHTRPKRDRDVGLTSQHETETLHNQTAVPVDKCPWNNKCIPSTPPKTCFFCVSPFPSAHTLTNLHDKPIPTHIPSYLFHFHLLAGFCLKSLDRQTGLSHIIFTKASINGHVNQSNRLYERCCCYWQLSSSVASAYRRQTMNYIREWLTLSEVKLRQFKILHLSPSSSQTFDLTGSHNIK